MLTLTVPITIIDTMIPVALTKQHPVSSAYDAPPFRVQNSGYPQLCAQVRKMYNPRNFKGLVSPHEFYQAIGPAARKLGGVIAPQR